MWFYEKYIKVNLVVVKGLLVVIRRFKIVCKMCVFFYFCFVSLVVIIK